MKESMSESMWQVTIDHSTRAEWSQMLDLFDDANIYQTWSYGRVRWGDKNLSHLVLKKDGDVVGMAQLRIVRPARLKFGMAYLRWGPLCERRGQPLNPEVFKSMACALKEEYVGKRKLFLRIIPNAFAGSPRAMEFQLAFSGFTPETLGPDNTYRTFVLDLAPTLEELRANLDKKWRNQLSRSEKNNLHIVEGTGKDKYRTFCLIYNQMRKRKSFETTVDTEEFARIQEDLPESQRMRIVICEDNNKPVAGLVASVHGDSAIYLLGATSDDGLNSKGAYFLHWTLIKWLKKNGIRWYDLGGIDPEMNPGVYHFKRGFSGTDVCQVNPLVASNGALSSSIVRAGLSIHGAIRGTMSTSRLALALKRLGIRN